MEIDGNIKLTATSNLKEFSDLLDQIAEKAKELQELMDKLNNFEPTIDFK